MISREQIKQTSTFKRLNPIQQRMVLKHTSFKEIDYNFNVINAIGLIRWRNLVNLNESRILIIEEIYANSQDVN